MNAGARYVCSPIFFCPMHAKPVFGKDIAKGELLVVFRHYSPGGAEDAEEKKEFRVKGTLHPYYLAHQSLCDSPCQGRRWMVHGASRARPRWRHVACLGLCPKPSPEPSPICRRHWLRRGYQVLASPSVFSTREYHLKEHEIHRCWTRTPL